MNANVPDAVYVAHDCMHCRCLLDDATAEHLLSRLLDLGEDGVVVGRSAHVDRLLLEVDVVRRYVWQSAPRHARLALSSFDSTRSTVPEHDEQLI